jgi:hypothetical protein
VCACVAGLFSAAQSTRAPRQIQDEWTVVADFLERGCHGRPVDRALGRHAHRDQVFRGHFDGVDQRLAAARTRQVERNADPRFTALHEADQRLNRLHGWRSRIDGDRDAERSGLFGEFLDRLCGAFRRADRQHERAERNPPSDAKGRLYRTQRAGVPRLHAVRRRGRHRMKLELRFGEPLLEVGNRRVA